MKRVGSLKSEGEHEAQTFSKVEAANEFLKHRIVQHYNAQSQSVFTNRLAKFKEQLMSLLGKKA